MPGLYLALLVFVLVCFGALDYKYKLVFFKDKIRAITVYAVSLFIFIIWDVLGIVLNIFFIGDTEFLTGILLGHEFPIEEIFFLTVLIYNPLIIYTFLKERVYV